MFYMSSVMRFIFLGIITEEGVRCCFNFSQLNFKNWFTRFCKQLFFLRYVISFH